MVSLKNRLSPQSPNRLKQQQQLSTAWDAITEQAVTTGKNINLSQTKLGKYKDTKENIMFLPNGWGQ